MSGEFIVLSSYEHIFRHDFPLIQWNLLVNVHCPSYRRRDRRQIHFYCL